MHTYLHTFMHFLQYNLHFATLLRKLFTTILIYIDVMLTGQTGYLHHLQIPIYSRIYSLLLRES